MSKTSWFSDPAYAAGLDRLASLESKASVTFAEQSRVLVELLEPATRDGWRGSAPYETVLLEVAGTCVIGQQSAAARLADAEHLVTHLPETLARLEAGTLGVPQARVLIGETRQLDAFTCSQVEKRVLLDAAELPPGRLRDRVRRLVLTLDAAEAARRAARARGNRRVWTRQADEDGMGLLIALLPAEHVAAVQLSLTEQARAMRNAGDQRNVDALRADLLTELLTGRRTAPPGPDLCSAGAADTWGAAGPAPTDADEPDCSISDGDAVPPADGPADGPPDTPRDTPADGPSDTPADTPPDAPTAASPPAAEQPVLDAAAEPASPGCATCGQPPRSAEPGTGPRTVVVVRPPQVVLHVPLATALGVSDAPGQLVPGGALLPAAQVHELLPSAELRALFVDAATGRPVVEGTKPVRRAPRRRRRRDTERAAPALTPQELRDLLGELVHAPVRLPVDDPEPQHDPSAPLARFVRLRDGSCDGIGCSVPASACELDHHDPWPQGATSAANLRARSQRCHHAKHHGWTVVRLADGGTTWTSPAARTYRTHPRWQRPPTIPSGTRLPPPEALAARLGELLTGRDPGDPGDPTRRDRSAGPRRRTGSGPAADRRTTGPGVSVLGCRMRPATQALWGLALLLAGAASGWAAVWQRRRRRRHGTPRLRPGTDVDLVAGETACTVYAVVCLVFGLGLVVAWAVTR